MPEQVGGILNTLLFGSNSERRQSSHHFIIVHGKPELTLLIVREADIEPDVIHGNEQHQQPGQVGEDGTLICDTGLTRKRGFVPPMPNEYQKGLYG
jgi:hypothetical protein